MKQYQVTKKLQVTIPKKLADKVGIKPGDSVIFEESADTIMLRKAATPPEDTREVKASIEEFAEDLRGLRLYVKRAEKALVEDFSRHITSE